MRSNSGNASERISTSPRASFWAIHCCSCSCQRMATGSFPATGRSSTGFSSSGGRSETSTSWPEAITVSQRQTFSSWRTLPGHGRRLIYASVSGCSILASTFSSFAARNRKCCASFGISSRRSRREGIWMRITFRRWNKSSRKSPAITRFSKSWWVAAMIRTSTWIDWWPPTR